MAKKRSPQSYWKALVFFIVGTSSLLFLMANRLSQADPEGQGFIIANILFLTLAPAITVGAFSSRSEREYSWLRFGV